jgi:hypothetical protein
MVQTCNPSYLGEEVSIEGQGQLGPVTETTISKTN